MPPLPPPTRRANPVSDWLAVRFDSEGAAGTPATYRDAVRASHLRLVGVSGA